MEFLKFNKLSKFQKFLKGKYIEIVKIFYLLGLKPFTYYKQNLRVTTLRLHIDSK